jgi:hypothetical protein
MLSFLATPWALLALLAVPALAAIYWLRSHSRPVPVSSLMLWADQREARQGGRRLDRLRLPLTFIVEALAIVLLAVAAAGPRAETGRAARPLVVVLDDSYSMQAGGEDSPRTQALAALREELERGGDYAVRFVRAGATPQVLGGPTREPGEALAHLAAWRCQAPTARLEEALGLAAGLEGGRAVFLVLTDEAPAKDPGRGRLRWWAFGSPRPNLAIVSAARSDLAGHERCLLEVANLSAEPQQTRLRVETEGAKPLHDSPLTLKAKEIRRVVLPLPAGTATVTARIGSDTLALDNQVTLLRAADHPVRTAVRIQDVNLRSLMEKALKATGRTVPGADRLGLLFTDQEGTPDPETWTVRLLVEKEAEAFVGPFLLDRTHPLTEGLSLQGVVWGGGTAALPGAPVILAGDVPLLTEAEQGGRHELWLRLRPDLSTLTEEPAWPVLLWNLVQWRAAQSPGLAKVNLRLGETAVLNVAPDVDAVEVVAPNGTRRRVAAHGGKMVVPADEIGRHELHAGGETYAFAVNAVNPQESDLSGCVSGRWGEWQEDSPEVEARGLAWVFVLLAAAVLTAHLALVKKPVTGGRGAVL